MIALSGHARTADAHGSLPATYQRFGGVRCSSRVSAITQVIFRPIRREDRAALAAGFYRLSAKSRERRFLGPKPRLTAGELDYLTRVDHVTHEAIVAIDRRGRMVGVARYATWPDERAIADLAVTVADDWHGRGLGTALARRVMEAARCNRIAVLTGSTLWDNEPARRLLHRLGFRPIGHEHGVIEFRLELLPAIVAAAA